MRGREPGQARIGGELRRAPVPRERGRQVSDATVTVADPHEEWEVRRAHRRDGLERRDRAIPAPERRVAGGELGLDLEVCGRALRDRLELDDELLRIRSRRVDEREHPARREVVGLPRRDLHELALRGGRIAGAPQRRPELEPRLDVPRSREHELAEQHVREVVLARVGRGLRRRAQRGDVVGSEVVRVGELARGAREELRSPPRWAWSL